MPHETDQNPYNPTLKRVGDQAFDADWNPIPITERKGWRYVVVNRKQIGLSALPDKTGAADPVIFNYIFGDAFLLGTNFWYEKIIKERL